MKKLLIAALGCLFIILMACSKQKEKFSPTGTYSGLLDSIISRGGDSGANQGFYQVFKFSYDSKRRIDKMMVISTNAGVEFYSFSYNGNEANPSSITDSMISSSSSAWVYKYQLFYDQQGNKVKDSSYRYLIDTPSKSIIRTDNLGIRTYERPAGLVVTKNGGIVSDSCFLDNTGNVEHISSGGLQVYLHGYFPDDLNPVGILNISKGASGIISFFGTSVYPLTKIDFLTYRHLFKKATGTNDTYYYCSANETTEINCYYEKDAANKVLKMVLPHYSYKNGNFCSLFYSNIEFYYQP